LLEESLLQSFFNVKAVSDRVVRYSLAYVSMQKWLVGDILLNVNFALYEPPQVAMEALRIGEI